ncbi:MAG TPA: adenylate/guanylate cyclase domain-containing protein [Acetobacteraceae bacterium]|nr:adenylate/guanylate cyclase domain-containing protein [Acetobacteraceae bacterium]
MRIIRPAPARLAGLIALAVLLMIWSTSFHGIRDVLRERALDTVLPLSAPSEADGPFVTIVDIDRDTLARFGPWPWPRARLARLIAAIATAHPAVLAVDMLLEGRDRFAPDKSDGGSVDGDKRLAQTLSTVPTVLGFVLDNARTMQDLPAAPVVSNAPIALPGIWHAAGLIGPTPVIAATAQGFGALVAAADVDGLIRRVPLLLLAGDTLRGGLAVEAVRVSQRSGLLLLESDRRLHVGDVSVPLDPSAELRLRPVIGARWERHTVSAAVLLGDPGAGARLAGHIVLLGSSAPEVGGLRPTPLSPVTPSVQIQAEAIDTLLRGATLYRPAWVGPGEIIAVAVLGLIVLLFAAGFRPLLAFALTVVACLAWTGVAIAAVPALALLVDPVGPGLVMLGSFAAAALARFAHDEWRARALRARFEQHLAPAVVRRIAGDPRALRLKGEQREITALFTDIEGFTSLTERAEPTELVALLDTYFDAATRVVTDHGGMVEKIVGDAVHAIFNAPFDLHAHTERAVACALKLLEITDEVRRSPAGQRLDLGRTRIGIETGLAIVGDIGGSRKLDYTAHGDVMNTAARLEAANKDLGSSICIGPIAAARLDPTSLRRMGTLTLRGQSQAVDVFSPAELVRNHSVTGPGGGGE